jgi:hypothetical protein
MPAASSAALAVRISAFSRPRDRLGVMSGPPQ